MKKLPLLHSALVNHMMDRTIRSTDVGPSYAGGRFSLFEICFDVDWDSKEGGWILTCPHALSNVEIQGFLSEAYECHPEGFSDELEIVFSDMDKEVGKIFFTDDGEKWMLADDLIHGIGIFSSSKHSRPSGKIKEFTDETVIYYTPEE